MELTQEVLKELVGSSFKGTIISDPALEPFFIIRYSEGGFGVMKTRRDAKGNLKYRVVSYPSTFSKCLETIAKEFQHEEGKVYESVQEYIENWKEVTDRIFNLYDTWKVEKI